MDDELDGLSIILHENRGTYPTDGTYTIHIEGRKVSFVARNNTAAEIADGLSAAFARRTSLDARLAALWVALWVALWAFNVWMCGLS